MAVLLRYPGLLGLADALEHAYRVLGFDEASGGDEVFGQLVLARIIEPASKLDILVNRCM